MLIYKRTKNRRKAKPKTPSTKFWHLVLAAFFVVAAAAIIGLRVWYDQNLRPVFSTSASQLFTVDTGSSAKQIAYGLRSLGLIRSSRAFIIYIDAKGYKDKLQAGTYNLNSSMSAQQIALKIATGEVDKNWLTILPAKRLDQIKQEFVRAGYQSSEVGAAFDPVKYRDDPSIASLPSGASLEGYLYPDSFQKEAATPASAIVRESLDEMQAHLTSDVTNGFAAQGLSVFQGITMASIVEKESGSAASQPTVAQVFLLRLKQGMMLGSDVTAYYASAIAGQDPSVGIDSPYNTRVHVGLPPGPIGNITDSALKAVASPAGTNYLYFVAGDDGVIHFSHTEAEHEAAIAQYCKKLCN